MRRRADGEGGDAELCKVGRGMGFWSPIGDSPFDRNLQKVIMVTQWVTKRLPIGDRNKFGDARTPV